MISKLMNESIKVSVIIPVYNVEKYFSKCLESLSKQTYKNIEIILVDDGSLDSSGSIADNYALRDKRIKVIHKENEGVSVARNTGIENATGDYICFIDGDDYVMPDYIEYLLNLIRDSNANISLTTEMFGNFNISQVPVETKKIVNAEDATVKMLLYDIPIGVYCKLFKRDFIEKEKIHFKKELFIGEGFNFNVDSFQRSNKVVIGNRKVYFYRRDNEMSATTKFSIEKWQNGLKAIEVIKNNLVINTKRVNKAWSFAYWRTYSDVYDIMVLAKVEKSYGNFFNYVRKKAQLNSFIAFIVPTSRKQKLRAAVFALYPKLIPIMMIKRRKKFKVNISN